MAPYKIEFLLESWLQLSSWSLSFRNQRFWEHFLSSERFRVWCLCGRFSCREGKPNLMRSVWWCFGTLRHSIFCLWLNFSDHRQDSTQGESQGMYHYHFGSRMSCEVWRCWDGWEQNKFWFNFWRCQWFTLCLRCSWEHNVWYLRIRRGTLFQSCLCPGAWWQRIHWFLAVACLNEIENLKL